MDRAEAVREMTFEEEAVLYQQEAKAIFAKEDVGCEAPPINHTVRRGMRIIRKAREEIAALREQEQREQGCEYCREDSEGYRTVFGAYSISNPVHGTSWQIRGGNLRPREIHFCPMCGRKLKEGAEHE